jgi:tetratricopeptide (TPR) repeat protein
VTSRLASGHITHVETAPTTSLRRLGDFEITREIGRGGMGVVYEARQVSLNRRVALKVLGPGLGLTPRAVERFRREAEAAAKLHHTNIVPVYATGEQGGVHYYAMELIDGPSLDAVIRQLRAGDADTPPAPTAAAVTGPYVPARATAAAPGSGGGISSGSSAERFNRAAAMVADVADALHHAHQQGVTHRDVKPSNLLLSPEGRLSVTDFGLARMLEQPGMTLTGEFVGTPAYMSPEQVTAGRVPVDHRTDVYSLGATLYELLTLRPPFAADGRDKLLAMVVQKEPAAPRSIDAKVPRDLETVCLKCLEKDPDRRYQSAKELADDLRRYLNRFAILARRAGPLTRARKWVKRNPGVAALLGCLLVAVLAAGFFAHQAKKDRDWLREEQRQAAVERAILEALSGDAQAALEAIADAENKGAEQGPLNLLRGAVETHRGRPKEALVYLEQADKQLPGSVAVKALSAKVYMDLGQFQRFNEMQVLLEGVQPRSVEDHLFLGLSQSDMDPGIALRTLDGMPARSRQSPVARLARATAQTMFAFQTGRAEDAEQALGDFARVDLPDNPLLLSTRMLACLAAAHAYGPNDPRGEAVRKQAAQDAGRLAAHRDNHDAVLRRCYYHFVRGDDGRVLEVIRQARKDRVETPFIEDLGVSVLYARKQYAEALNVLEASPAPEGYVSLWLFQKGIVLVTVGRKKEAEQAFTEAIRRYKGIALSFLPAYLQLLGPEYAAKSRQAALDVRSRTSHLIPNVMDRWYHHLLAYNAGLIGEEELLSKAGENRFNLCEAHWFIGIRKLAGGKRGEAKASFRLSVGTGVFFYFESIWSRAFLAHIDDPDWLPWLAAGR